MFYDLDSSIGYINNFLIFNEKLLIMFGASEKTLPYALEYMNIYILGTVFVLIVVGINP